ncbi:MAG: S8 family serine peptidase [Rubripirellula sp.]
MNRKKPQFSPRRIQQLEDRILLASDVSSQEIHPDWFAEVSSVVESTQKYIGPIRSEARFSPQSEHSEWIVRISSDVEVESVVDVDRFLDTEWIDFHVQRGLGRTGLVLVHANAIHDRVHAALHGNSLVADYSQNETVNGAQLPNDPEFASLVGFQNLAQFGGTLDADIDAPEAWDVSTGSTSVVVGVVDSGIDPTHPDLYLNVWLNQGEIQSAIRPQLTDIDGDQLISFYDLNNVVADGSGAVTSESDFANGPNSGFVSDLNSNGVIDAADLLIDPRWSDGRDTDGNGFIDDLFGWNFRRGDEEFAPNNPSDVNGHGTHISGTIGAVGNNALGVTGLNWRSSIMALKFLDRNNQGNTADAVAAIMYAAMMRSQFDVNVPVLNNSWGQSGGFSSVLESAITSAEDANILFVAAAGNGNVLGRGIDNDQSPFYPASYDVDNVVAVAAVDSRDRLARFSNFGSDTVDVAAPGVGVISTSPGGVFESANGTSMATAHVSGTAALIFAELPGATAGEVRRAILETTDPLAIADRSRVARGRINADAAINFTGFAPTASLIEARDISTAGGTQQDIVIQFNDRNGIATDSIDTGDLLITLQRGQQPTFTPAIVPGSVQVSQGGTQVIATYRLTPPGGSWDAVDFGEYEISVAGNEVSATGGLNVPEQTIGSFFVRVDDPSVYYVDTLLDAVDANIGDGVCSTVDGTCSLRAATQEANAATDARTIILGSGTHVLEIPGQPSESVSFSSPNFQSGCGSDAASLQFSDDENGDLDLKGNVTIIGDTATDTVIDGGGFDRVFKVWPGATASLQSLGITGGRAPDLHAGGGILSSGVLSLNLVEVFGNETADGPYALGGGLAIWGERATITASSILDNTALGGAGVFLCNAAEVTIEQSTIARNFAHNNATQIDPTGNHPGGAGILGLRSGPVELTNTTLSSNTVAFVQHPTDPEDSLNPNDNLGGAIRFDDLSTIQPVFGFAFNDFSTGDVSRDGRFVTFTSQASLIVPYDTNGASDLFLLDRVDGSVQRVTESSAGVEQNFPSSLQRSSISDDGNLIVFQASASNLVDGDTNDSDDVFLLQRDTGNIERIPINANGEPGNFHSESPVISGNGRYVAFVSLATNAEPVSQEPFARNIFLHDRVSQTSTKITNADLGSSEISISRDGDFVFSTSATLLGRDEDFQSNIFLYDVETQQLTRVTPPNGGIANGASFAPQISADGNVVVFQSFATNLDGSPNGASQIYRWDRTTNQFHLVSATGSGQAGNNVSSKPVTNEDGSVIAFLSQATNLAGKTSDNSELVVADQNAGTLALAVPSDPSNERQHSDPVLSADGSRLVFHSRPQFDNGNDTIFELNRLTGVLTNLTDSLVPVSPATSQDLLNVSAIDNRGSTTLTGSGSIRNSLFVGNKWSGGVTADVGNFDDWVLESNLIESTGVLPTLLDPTLAATLGPLADNGGPTLTHALLPGSPARDAGDPAQFPLVDQRGVARPANGDGIGEAIPDVGAFEASLGSISGTVYLDLDGDARQDLGEPGLEGIEVFIDQNANGLADPDELLQLTSDSLVDQGSFDFKDLPPDEYQLGIAAPAGFSVSERGLRRIVISLTEEQPDRSVFPTDASTDGRFTLIHSVGQDAGGSPFSQTDLFVYDNQLETIEFITENVGGSRLLGRISGSAISGDGRYVVYESTAPNLVPGGNPGEVSNIYLHDRFDRTTRLLSVGFDFSSSSGFDPSITADGRLVAFNSFAGNLVPTDSNNAQDLFLFDTVTEQLTIGSVTVDGQQGNSGSSGSISDDGRFLFLTSSADNLTGQGTNEVFIRLERATGANILIRPTSTGEALNDSIDSIAISGDGRYIAFSTPASNVIPASNASGFDFNSYLFDLDSGDVRQLNVDLSGQSADGFSFVSDISFDGRFVVFHSFSTDIVPGGTSGAQHGFLFDRQTGTNQLVTKNDNGEEAQGTSNSGIISGNGAQIAFASFASNLIENDINLVRDVFQVSNPSIPVQQQRAITIFPGQDFDIANIGLTPNPGSISGTLFLDANGNEFRDSIETGLADLTVFLDLDGNRQRNESEPFALTDSSGQYVFEDVPSETLYEILVDPVDGFLQTFPSETAGLTVRLPAGTNLASQDFGFRPDQSSGVSDSGRIEGRVSQHNSDGSTGGVAGVTVFLEVIGDGDDGVRQFNERQTLTLADDPSTPDVDETGLYFFDDLGSQSFVVRTLLTPDQIQLEPVGSQFTSESYPIRENGVPFANPQDAEIADLNGDTLIDVAFPLFDANAIGVRLATSPGRFDDTTINIPLGNNTNGPIALELADFNGNAELDAVVVNSFTSNVTVLLDFNGSEFGSKVTLPVGDTPLDVATGDFNRDGLEDFAVVNEQDNNVSVLINDGAGGFSLGAEIPSGGQSPVAITVGQFDDDGRPDIAIANNGVSPLDPGNVGVILNLTTGFEDAVTYPAGDGPISITSARLNGDATDDIAVASIQSNSVTVLSGSPTGEFTALENNLPVGLGPIQIRTADIEGDGDVDVLAANLLSQNVSILRNLLSRGEFAFEPAENFGVSQFSVADQLAFAPSDLDRNGTVDLVVVSTVDDSLRVLSQIQTVGGNRTNLDGVSTRAGLDFTVSDITATFTVPGAGETVDLQALSQGELAFVTAFDIRGSGDNRLLLDFDTLLNSQSNDFTITSNLGDEIVFDPGWQFDGVAVQAEQFGRRITQGDVSLFVIGPSDWSNPIEPADVDGNGSVTAADALQIINELSRGRFQNPDGTFIDAATVDQQVFRFYDVDQSNALTSLDALRVINAIQRFAVQGEAEDASSNLEASLKDSLFAQLGTATL